MLASAGASLAGLVGAPAAAAACANPVACENQLAGDPPSDWETNGAGSPSIQGYATQMSVNPGDTVSFKINTPSTAYHIDILRLGYYQGNGARKIVSNMKPTAALPQSQPSCLTDSSTGLIDCGNWSVSASWTVPKSAVSGVYIAHLVRDDLAGADSQIPFVVRNDAGTSTMLVSTDDATWEAYNAYGGNSLYSCTVACPPGNPKSYKGAFAVSYNRPFDGASLDGGASYLYYVEYQMIRFLERNGYDVSYTSDVDLDRGGAAQITNHRILLTSGHDEYWSGGERANVTAARDAGVNLAFFTGNEIWWKTRWANSGDGTNTPYRTLVSYKETHFDAPVDPQDPPTWTGSWLDPRFSPPADGGVPSTSLSGQLFAVNSGTGDIVVPYAYAKDRLWRGTGAASLSSGQSLTLGKGIGDLGYEWDVDVDNGFRPPGLMDLSSTTLSGTQTFTDYGSTTLNNQSATHHLTLYRAASGAMVFGAGTVQWAWGLDNTNAWSNSTTDPSGLPPDRNMQQATVNLLADMGAQPTTLISGLAAATASSDTTAPTSKISSPAAGASLGEGSRVTVSGTASDTGGGVVAGVEISTDGGGHWHPATVGNAASSVSWSYSWNVTGVPATTIETRAVDDSGNLETPSDAISVKVGCPCSLWGSLTPATTWQLDSGDPSAVEVGNKFRSDSFGQVTGIRFYKATTNTGTHVATLYDTSGNALASATFTSESAAGWQSVTFAKPVIIYPNTTYIAAYYAPSGHYSSTQGYFYPPPSPPPYGGGVIDAPPLHGIPNATSPNGVFSYSSTPTFPKSSYNATNYWVDATFTTLGAPGQVTGVKATAIQNGAQITWSAPGGGPATTYTVTPYIGSTAQKATVITGTPANTYVTITGLTAGTAYTFTVQASNPAGAGAVSSASTAVTPSANPTAPDQPTGVTASPASGQAIVSWTPPDSGGSAITAYTITPYIGSTGQAPTQVSNGSATSAVVTGLTNGTTYTFTVKATNAVGTGQPSAASAAVKPQYAIFDAATPTMTDSGDPTSQELGVKFTADAGGTITGIRFYKSAANTGTHVGSLWDAGGNLLAQATFTGETASGWQYVTFPTPVTITAGTTYVAAYLAPNGHYSSDQQKLAIAVDNPPLHSLASSTSANGVFKGAYSTAFPTSSYNATNYYVDVLFSPSGNGSPTAPTNVTATPANGQAQVRWTAPWNGGNPITTYTITPYAGSTAGTPVTISNGSATSGTVTGLTDGTAYAFTVTATNSAGTGPASAASAPVTPQFTIFDFGTSPTQVDSGDAASNTLGVKFTVDTPGTVTGVRFYKAAANIGTHIGSVWNAAGNLLAQATFTGESGSGWQSVTFSSPVSVTPGNTYVAGYFAPSGHYSSTPAGLATGVDNSPLHAVSNIVSADGVYGYGSSTTFPTSTYNAGNYFVDVLFTPTAGFAPQPPNAPTGVVASPANGQALVSWSPSYNGGSATTGYTVTPYAGATAGTPVTVSGASATSAVVTGLTNGTAYTFTVTATNAVGTSAASAASAPATPENTLFDFSSPTMTDSGDGTAQTLGVKFTADVAGTVTGVRFYKALTNGGTHIGGLWDSGGNLLAQATFTGESGSGWQSVTFATPVTITAGATYVAGYLAPNGHYSSDQQKLANGLDNPPLHAVPGSAGGNGVFKAGSSLTFPTGSYNATNYYVDVLFAPAPAPPPGPPAAPATVFATPAGGQAKVSWAAPSNGGSPITGYVVTPYQNGTAGSPVQVSDGSATSATVTGLTNGQPYAFTVAATNANGTGPASTPSAAVTPEDTLFDLATPALADSGDTSSQELGVKFTSDLPGSVTGIRFYKAAANTGTHVASLWDGSGSLLAQATVSGESASGWQYATFPSPVNISAGLTYVAGYFAPNGHYSSDQQKLANGFDNPPLHAVANSTSPNGVFGPGVSSVFPTGSYNATNYYVDVLFAPGAPVVPGQPGNVSATPATGQAQVSWSPPASNGGSAITGYTVTPYSGSAAGMPVTVSGGSATSTVVSGLSNGTAYTFTVAATNSVGTGQASAPSPAVTPQDTIFDFGTPSQIDSGDTTPNTLGVKFTSDVNAAVTGIRFYKAAANTGTHVVSLWDASGNLLAQATATGESPSGWQTVLFPSPVQITAGTTYVAGYLAPNGHYSSNSGGLAGGVDNPPLHALANSVSPNGVYATGSTTTFPTNTYNAGNYWVDVLVSTS